MSLSITTLEIEGEPGGGSKVKVWVSCGTPDDIDDVIEWLKLAKTVMEQWKQIREANP